MMYVVKKQHMELFVLLMMKQNVILHLGKLQVLVRLHLFVKQDVVMIQKKEFVWKILLKLYVKDKMELGILMKNVISLNVNLDVVF